MHALRHPLSLPPLTVAAVLVATVVMAAELAFPELTGRVVDQAELLTPEEERSLTAALKSHEDATGEQVVVATISTLQGTTIEDFGLRLGRHWGIGQQGEDNGAIVLVAPNEREVRIEVGYGLEGRLTDAASKLIIENVMIPAFRAGDFGPGIVAGTGAVLQVLSGEEVAIPQGTALREQDRDRGYAGLGPVLPMLLMGAFWFFAGRRRFGRRRYLPMGGPWYGGGRGGGGFGGGFGGGGGGFGGGGASGRW